MLCAKTNKMFMRTVQQNVFLILNSVPVTCATDPELIRPSIPVMTHSLDQKVMARKAKARKCTAIIYKLMCEEQHMHNERVWNIKHGLVQSLFCCGPCC